MNDDSKGAVISDCGTYRYALWRTLAPRESVDMGGVVLWVMVNPSTATATEDDATVRKVMGFSRRWGFGQARIVNLYALRSRDPKALLTHPNPIGPDNDHFIGTEAAAADAIVLAWGNNANHERAKAVRQFIEANVEHTPIWHLGLTGKGQPSHPLMLGYDTPRVEID